MSRMRDVRGLAISEDTVVAALEKYGFTFKPESYVFQAGDVAETGKRCLRIIVKIDGQLYAIDNADGIHTTTGQAEFEKWGYKKVGELKDLLKVPKEGE